MRSTFCLIKIVNVSEQAVFKISQPLVEKGQLINLPQKTLNKGLHIHRRHCEDMQTERVEEAGKVHRKAW